MAIAMGYIFKQSRKSTESVGELQRSIEFTQDDVKTLRAEKDTLQTQVNNLSLKLAEVERKQRVDRLFAEDTRDQLNVVDNNVNCRNLTIDGIKVTPGENPMNIAWDILRRMDNQLRFEDIDKAFRSGVSRGGRPILVLLVKAEVRDRILSKKPLLKNMPDLAFVSIQEDANLEIKAQKANVRAISRMATSQNIPDVKPRGRGLVYNDRYYSQHNLDQLPPQLQLENTRMCIGPDYIAYYSDLSPLSNMYPCTIILEAQKYHSVEQAFSHAMAKFAGDDKACQQVLDSQDGYAAKRAVRGLVTQDWMAVAETKLYELDLLKFQDPTLSRYLLSTLDKVLIETTASNHWGSACTINSSLIPLRKFKGNNVAGTILMNVRSEIKRSLGLGIQLPSPLAHPQAHRPAPSSTTPPRQPPVTPVTLPEVTTPNNRPIQPAPAVVQATVPTTTLPTPNTTTVTTTVHTSPISTHKELNAAALRFTPGADAHPSHEEKAIERVAQDIADQLKAGAMDHPIFALMERSIRELPTPLPQRKPRPVKSLSPVHNVITLLPPTDASPHPVVSAK